MKCCWNRLLLLAGVLWATAEAVNYNELATEVANRMNATLSRRVPIWSSYGDWSLPKFDLQFKNGYAWHVRNGRVLSFDSFRKDANEAATLSRSGNNLFLTFKVAMENLRANYTFDCAAGNYKYSNFTTVSVLDQLSATIKLKITYDGDFNCNGEAYNVASTYNDYPHTCNQADLVGADISKPGCPKQSWTDYEEVRNPFIINFCRSFRDTMDKLLFLTATVALRGLNLCPM